MTSAVLGGTGSGGGFWAAWLAMKHMGFITEPEWVPGLALPFPCCDLRQAPHSLISVCSTVHGGPLGHWSQGLLDAHVF